MIVRSIGKGRPPAQLAADRLVVGDQRGDVAWPPGPDHGRDRVAGHHPRHLDHLAHRIALADAQIEGHPALLVERLERQNVGVGQVGDVDVVADAGTVRGRIVVAIDLDVRALAQGHLEHERDQVGLGPMVLADVAARVRAGGVEVAQAQ